MNHPEEPIPSLSQIEAEVLAEGREWTRQRMQARLQQLADQHGELFPPSFICKRIARAKKIEAC